MSAPRMASRLRLILSTGQFHQAIASSLVTVPASNRDLDDLAGIAGDDRVGRHVAADHRARRHDRSVADLHARQDDCFHADPYIIADDRVAPDLAAPALRIEAFLPAMAEDVERIGRKAGHRMVGAVHDEARALGDGAEAADHQPVADERIMVQHAFLDETVRPVGIVVIGELADLDIRRVDQRLQEADPRMHLDGMFYRGIRPGHGNSFPRPGASATGPAHQPRDPVMGNGVADGDGNGESDAGPQGRTGMRAPSTGQADETTGAPRCPSRNPGLAETAPQETWRIGRRKPDFGKRRRLPRSLSDGELRVAGIGVSRSRRSVSGGR